MKHIFTAFTLLIAGNSLACDVCGCGAANTAMGLGTVAAGNRSAFGINWQYRSFHSLHENFFGMPQTHGVTLFNRFDLYGNIRLARRWQLKVIVPVVYNRETESGVQDVRTGIADPSFSVNYFFIDRQDTARSSQFRWSIGLGGKAPFAKYSDPNDENQFLNPGTGTWDATAATTVFARWNKWGIIAEANFMLRGENKYHYTPGNVLNLSAYGFHRWKTWSAFAGVQYMYSGDQYLNRHPLNLSPATGNILSCAVGASVQVRKLMFQANFQLPVMQILSEPGTQQLAGLNLSATIFID